MIKVTVIAMAHTKEKYFKDAAEEYKKRLSRYCKLDIIELEPERLPDNPSRALIDAALKKEAQDIMKKIPDGSKTVAMCVEGKSISSEKFAEMIKGSAMDSGSVTFIIGSSYGLCEELKKKCSLRISASDMTFPHQLFRIMLLEQIYRAFKIIEGGTYHK